MQGVSTNELRYRQAVLSIKKQIKSSKKTIKRLAKEADYVETLRLYESTSGLEWAVNHIERHLRE